MESPGGGTEIGLVIPTVETAGNLYAAAFRLTMVPSIFGAPSLVPSRLGTIAAWNPVSVTVTAVRELFGHPVAGGGTWIEEQAMLMAVVWPPPITTVFPPLAARRFQRLSR